VTRMWSTFTHRPLRQAFSIRADVGRVPRLASYSRRRAAATELRAVHRQQPLGSHWIGSPPCGSTRSCMQRWYAAASRTARRVGTTTVGGCRWPARVGTAAAPAARVRPQNPRPRSPSSLRLPAALIVWGLPCVTRPRRARCGRAGGRQPRLRIVIRRRAAAPSCSIQGHLRAAIGASRMSA
jgi:hypothetical protein